MKDLEVLGRTKPYEHQLVGVERLTATVEPELGRVLPNCFALFDEQGCGKTKQVIDAAQTLFHAGEIDTVIVLVPGPNVRSVWFDPELGQLESHLWNTTPAVITEHHARIKRWTWGNVRASHGMRWFITNYEFIRSENRRFEFNGYLGPRTLLVLDESSAVSNLRAEQTKAVVKLRRECGRVWILNGTPGNPGHIFSQFYILDPRIIGCQNPFSFRARYALMGGFKNKQVVGWLHAFEPNGTGDRCAMSGCALAPTASVHAWDGIGDIQRRTAPYVLRRLKDATLDLPEKIPPVTMTAQLTERTWDVYREMRDELMVWLDQNAAATASQAGVKALRLAQICAGFVGGVIDPENLGITVPSEDPFESDDGFPVPPPSSDATTPLVAQPEREVGREKLDLFLSWLDDQLTLDPELKLIVWCRFRPEVKRLLAELRTKPNLEVGAIWGGQKGPEKKIEREAALRALDPRTAPKGPVIVVGTPQSGARGLNLTACHTMMYLTNGTSLMARQQSEDRVHRPGQLHKVNYFDVIATGPQGQRTIEHSVIKALRAQEELANWTSSAWVDALREEVKKSL